GTTDAEQADARAKAKAQMAFYGSTPAYAGVLDHHGHEGLQPELNAMSKQGRWREMTDRISDDLLELVAVTGSPAEVGRKLAERNAFAARSTMMFYGPPPDNEAIGEAVAAARQASSGADTPTR
ncbi:MAG: LLM class flavin-dependent oxidoreductase, partial [Actinomycetota bacterium]